MARILLIEDDDLVRDTLRRTLTEAGHEVTLAHNGLEGLRKFSQETPDLVITDIIMPEKEGIETIQSLRSLDGRIPIIAMSGVAVVGDFDVLSAAKKLGANRVLRKPFRSKDLLIAIDESLGLS